MYRRLSPSFNGLLSLARIHSSTNTLSAIAVKLQSGFKSLVEIQPHKTKEAVHIANGNVNTACNQASD